MEYHIRQYGLQQGALEIQYIEEYFGEFPRRKTSSEVVSRLDNRDHQILMAEAALPDDPGTVVPVAYKVSHELKVGEPAPHSGVLVLPITRAPAASSAWRNDATVPDHTKQKSPQPGRAVGPRSVNRSLCQSFGV